MGGVLRGRVDGRFGGLGGLGGVLAASGSCPGRNVLPKSHFAKSEAVLAKWLVWGRAGGLSPARKVLGILGR